MGWEYFNGRPGGKERPWEWAQAMTRILRGSNTATGAPVQVPVLKPSIVEADPDDEGGMQAPMPDSFEYHSDGVEEGS